MTAKKKDTTHRKVPEVSPGIPTEETSGKKRGQTSPACPGNAVRDSGELIHDLQVHQIELESQAEELRRAQLALAESRDQFLDLYEFAPLGYLTLTDKALISRSNLTAATLLGVDRRKLDNARFRKWIAPDNQGTWDAYFTNLLHSGNKLTTTLTLVRGDGSRFPARLESIRLGGGGGQSIRVAISDISDIRMAEKVEEKLRETREYLDNLITYASGPIVVWDPQFRITLFNRAFEHLTGRKAKDILGQRFDILLPETHLPPAMELIRKTLDGERWESVEIPVLDKKGEIRTVLWNSAAIFGSDGKTIVSTIALGQDITDLKKTESEYRLKAAEYKKLNLMLNEEARQRKLSDTELKKTLSLLNASLESTTDGIFVVDLKGKVTSYNQNFVTMWDIPAAVMESRDKQSVMNYVLPQLKNPDEFLASIKELQSHPGRESFDMIEFNDGRIFERYSKPQKLGDKVVGRVWSAPGYHRPKACRRKTRCIRARKGSAAQGDPPPGQE